MKHYNFEMAAVVLTGSTAAREFLEPIFAERNKEIVMVAFCDERLRIIQLLAFPGCKDFCEVSMREIVHHASGSTGLIMAHNHVSGNPLPSTSDLHFTRRLSIVAEAIDLQLLDHLIFANGKMVSLRQEGLL